MKRLLLAVGIFAAFLAGYGAASTFAFPGGGIHGRAEYHGYFTNTYDDFGTYVLRRVYQSSTEAMPNTIDTAQEFIDFIKYTKLDLDNNGSGTAADKTGAAFIIHTMLGTPASSRSRPPTAAQISEWEARVRFAESKRWIAWRVNFSFTINSYFQGAHEGPNPNDDAFYDDSGTRAAMVFRNASGQAVYILKWDCGNPIGTTSLGPIADNHDWNAAGRSTVSTPTAAPGQTVTFNHYVRNTGPQATSPDAIWSATLSHPSNATIRGGHYTGYYNVGEEKLVDTQEYVIPLGTPPGTSICQKVLFDWANAAGARNGMGPPACVTVIADFALTPTITVQVNGSPPTGSMAEQGDTITFTYGVNNGGTTPSQSVNCTIYGRTMPGSYAVPTPPDSSSTGGYVSPPTGCPRVFPAAANTTVATESTNAAAANTTICRSLFVNPATASGENRGTEVCVRIVGRPYLKVYGGDVSVGGGIESEPNVCTNNGDASAVSWNKRGGGGYSGAGVQYAAFALDAINDFASAQNAGASAAAPTALSFGNTTTNVTNGAFGGDFGSAPCIPDYYGTKPASTTALGTSVNVSPLVSGTYAQSGSVTITGGEVNPGNRMTLYIDGDAFITGNITYPGSWNVNNTPLFELVVKGNIYIAPSVTQLDGMYVAQPDGSSGGTIYTCATSAAPLALSGPLFTTCNSKLTINGAFAAHSVEFLRTRGSLAQSTAAEANSSNNIAEVFNFTPSLWIPQPPARGGEADNYDAITSLPPVL